MTKTMPHACIYHIREFVKSAYKTHMEKPSCMTSHARHIKNSLVSSKLFSLKFIRFIKNNFIKVKPISREYLDSSNHSSFKNTNQKSYLFLKNTNRDYPSIGYVLVYLDRWISREACRLLYEKRGLWPYYVPVIPGTRIPVCGASQLQREAGSSPTCQNIE